MADAPGSWARTVDQALGGCRSSGLSSTATAPHQAMRGSAIGQSVKSTGRRKRLVRSLEVADDPDGELARDVSVRLAELAGRGGRADGRAADPGGGAGADAGPEAVRCTTGHRGPNLARVSDERGTGAVRRLPAG